MRELLWLAPFYKFHKLSVVPSYCYCVDPGLKHRQDGSNEETVTKSSTWRKQRVSREHKQYVYLPGVIKMGGGCTPKCTTYLFLRTEGRRTMKDEVRKINRRRSKKLCGFFFPLKAIRSHFQYVRIIMTLSF